MSYASLNYHIVFSTKDRRPLLTPDILPRLKEYIAGIIRNGGGKAIETNGCNDHLHVVASLSASACLADHLRTIKTNSSKWIHEMFPNASDFAWQDSYAAFSVSLSVLPKVIEYIRAQQEHHRKVSFQDELVAMLKKHGIKYDDRYV
jgi:REP element-mobilizing transposase RayT